MRGHHTLSHGRYALYLVAITLVGACSLPGPVDTGGESNEAAGAAPPTMSTGGSADTTGSGESATTTGGGETDPEPSCDDPPAGIDPTTLGLCPSDICSGGARCVPTVLLESTGNGDQADRLADCDAESKCVPDDFVASMGFFTPTTCNSLLGAEGRCLSTCIPEVGQQDEEVGLPVDSCGAHQVCAPCFDPRTGESTGACEQSCDEGPVEEPILLPTCCGGIGTCVPTSAVPSAQLENLGDYGCAAETQGDFICAPNVFVEDLEYSPPACDDLPFLVKVALPAWAQEARCLPDCLPALDDSPVALQQGACPAQSLCTPCYQPGGLIGLGEPEPTGACDY